MKLLLLFLLTTVGSSAKSLFSRTYSPTDVPNPMLHPEACGRSGVPKSAICDPSLLLLKDNKDVIEGFINGVVGAVVAVAIVDEMTPSFVAGDDKEVAAKRFAKSLHDDWGVGDKDTNNGILIFLSINDRTVYISTGAGVKGKVTAQYVDYLISEMKPDLKAGNYGTAIEKTVTQIRLIMSDQSDIAKRISSGEWSDNWFIGLLVAGGLAVSGVAVHNTRKLNQLRRGRVALDKFMSEVEEASDHKKFISESCPICLEQFSTFRAAGDGHVEEANAEGNVYNKLSSTGDTEEVGKKKDLEVGISPTTSGVKDDSPKRAMALHCGHVFCYECLSGYLKTREGTKCPICRAPVSGGALPPPPPPTPPPRPPSDDRPVGGPDGGRGNGRIGSCSDTFYSQNTGYSDGYTMLPYSPLRDAEFLFRMNRMQFLYPRVMTPETVLALNSALSSGSMADFRRAALVRSAEVNRTITDIETRNTARTSGSSGSSYSSFGGGSSMGGGGGGGSW